MISNVRSCKTTLREHYPKVLPDIAQHVVFWYLKVFKRIYEKVPINLEEPSRNMECLGVGI